MTIRSRLERVAKRLGADLPGGPLTVVLNEAAEGRPSGTRRLTNSAGLPVVEVTYDPAAGAVDLPPPPFKLVAGADPVDLV